MPACLHVYTGNGKGKTTAAMGLALRAAGAGLNVFVGQFIKNRHSSELDSINGLGKSITIRQYGAGFIYNSQPSEHDILCAQAGFEEVEKEVWSEKYRLVVLDEMNLALKYELIPWASVLEFIRSSKSHVELVFTGRYAPEQLLEEADLITEMQDVRHYALKGVQARLGIEI